MSGLFSYVPTEERVIDHGDVNDRPTRPKTAASAKHRQGLLTKLCGTLALRDPWLS